METERQMREELEKNNTRKQQKRGRGGKKKPGQSTGEKINKER